MVGHGKHREVTAEEPHERLLGAEDQPAGDRVQPVGADEQVEGSRGAALERHLDPAPVVVHRSNRVVEDVLDLAASGFVDDLGEVAAHDLDVPLRNPLADHLGGHLDRAAAGTDQTDHLRLRPGPFDLGKHPHPIHQLHRRTEQINGMAAATHPQPGDSLDHRGLETEPVQPKRQHRTRHTCPGNQHPRPLNRHLTPRLDNPAILTTTLRGGSPNRSINASHSTRHPHLARAVQRTVPISVPRRAWGLPRRRSAWTAFAPTGVLRLRAAHHGDIAMKGRRRGRDARRHRIPGRVRPCDIASCGARGVRAATSRPRSGESVLYAPRRGHDQGRARARWPPGAPVPLTRLEA